MRFVSPGKCNGGRQKTHSGPQVVWLGAARLALARLPLDGLLEKLGVCGRGRFRVPTRRAAYPGPRSSAPAGERHGFEGDPEITAARRSLRDLAQNHATHGVDRRE